MKFYLGSDPRAPCASSRCKPTILLSWTVLDEEAEPLRLFRTNVVTMVTH